MASQDRRWVMMHDVPTMGLRLPLYSGKLDLFAIIRCFRFDPVNLSVHVNKADDELEFHPISIDYSTGLSRLTWDELAEEVSLVYGAPFPDGKVQGDSLFIKGSPLDFLPSCLSKLSKDIAASPRDVVDVESVICHRFVFIFRQCLKVQELDNIAADMKLPEEEDRYVDRHLSPAALAEYLGSISLPVPESYRWLEQAEIAEQMKVFPATGINLDVQVKSRSTAVLAHGSDAVLGIDLVSDMTQGGVNRCEIEFYLWATLSSLPYLQLITDLKTGAFVFYFIEDAVIACETISVQQLQDFVRALVLTLPSDATSQAAWSVLKRIKRNLLNRPSSLWRTIY